MNAIVAVDKNWSIGKDNHTLVSIPGDTRYFYNKILGNVVVMGRKTLQSLPGSRPISGCVNIVLTRQSDYKVNGAYVIHTLDELFDELSKYNSNDVYVIGGSKVYSELLPFCNTAYVTKIDYIYDADCNFPNLDNLDEWSIESSSDEYTYFDLEYKFLKYMNFNLLKPLLSKK